MRHPPAVVALRAVTDAEYADYRQRSVPEHAAELTRARRVPTEQALRMTRENFPAGLADLLARATMLAAEHVVRSEGFGRIALNVFGGNDRAEGLYRSLGYGVDSTQLSKSLEDPR